MATRLGAVHHIRLVAFVLASIAGVRLAVAQQQPSREPILRVETGMHTASIKAAATNAAGHILVTASLDKTVRLWSLADGAPIRVLRRPIGYGPEGQLNAGYCLKLRQYRRSDN